MRYNRDLLVQSSPKLNQVVSRSELLSRAFRLLGRFGVQGCGFRMSGRFRVAFRV